MVTFVVNGLKCDIWIDKKCEFWLKFEFLKFNIWFEYLQIWFDFENGFKGMKFKLWNLIWIFLQIWFDVVDGFKGMKFKHWNLILT